MCDCNYCCATEEDTEAYLMWEYSRRANELDGLTFNEWLDSLTPSQ